MIGVHVFLPGSDDNAAIARVQEFFKNNPVRESWPWRHWNAQPLVSRTINRRISGFVDRSFHDVLKDMLPELGLSLPVGRAVSLGCGRGRQDRSLFRHGIVNALVGYDISPDSVEAAQRLAISAGIDAFDYRVGDLNALELPESSFDLIVAEMSLHHTTELERLFDVVARALKPNGLLIADEYVGPTRFRWTETQMRTTNGFLSMLSETMRTTPDGIIKPLIEHQPPSFFDAVDPSESIRSGEVITCMEQRFDIIWQRPYGGTLLHPMLHDIACNFREGDLFAEAFLNAVISMEDVMMATGELASDFATLVARPK
ncbi:Methyltransferase domain-containing protein [Rhizobium sp. RU35A]|uniref:class I SAM-dependent methyltransferase n=1 Tax=Rhizobium sp. RU35A TaxID=1907414 RepID=UPI0009551F0C|nr:class I SAM-dependent methyltransferase [Rhizobium sp. RU35A]SIQ48837.1 Methyltransferase domain-containing protein [Rhizobium sp. RU35A]